jgi:hypothetical protein
VTDAPPTVTLTATSGNSTTWKWTAVGFYATAFAASNINEPSFR